MNLLFGRDKRGGLSQASTRKGRPLSVGILQTRTKHAEIAFVDSIPKTHGDLGNSLGVAHRAASRKLAQASRITRRGISVSKPRGGPGIVFAPANSSPP
jgi:hypothetical protein